MDTEKYPVSVLWILITLLVSPNFSYAKQLHELTENLKRRQAIARMKDTICLEDLATNKHSGSEATSLFSFPDKKTKWWLLYGNCLFPNEDLLYFSELLSFCTAHCASKFLSYWNQSIVPLELGLWCLMPFSTIFQLYHGCQF